MRYMPIVLGTAAALMFATDVQAQDRPDFSGSWTQVQEGGAAPPAGGRGGGRGGGGLGMTATIAQTATTLTITRSFGETQFVATYNLDGSESTNTITGGRGGGGMAQVSTAAWDGAKLVITTTSEGRGGGQTQTTMALSLNAEGNLVVESTRPGRGGGAATTISTTYTKG